MAKGEFKCSKCDRTFSMAAHLARHTSTIHATKARKKTGKKRTAKPKVKRKVGRPKGAKRKVRRAGRRPMARGTAGLIRQLQVHQRQLTARHAELETQRAALDQAIEAMSGKQSARPMRQRRKGTGGRSTRSGSLADHIAKVLRQTKRPMTPGEVAKRVVQAGYQTRGKSLANQVSNALRQMRGVKRVRRGLYRA